MDVARGNEIADAFAPRGAEMAANVIAPQVAALAARERLLRGVHRRIGAAMAHMAGVDQP
eukprot:9215620-Pyramimonas_sp.AAC.1